jgi:tryptophan synthase alpha chain
MGRLGDTFVRLRGEQRGGLIAYVTAGDPDAPRSEEILVALAEGGADVLEVGVPFSDPVADGPVIQRASERALAAGMTLNGTLDLVARLRTRIETPIVLFTYANPVLRMGPAAFAERARAAGADGVLMLDYPVEEAAPLRAPLVAAGLDPIFLISPTTTDVRLARSAQLGAGFLYLISRLGVTGARDEVASGASALVKRVRQHSPMPVALGFGISRPEQVAAVCRHADAAVVGSAIVNVVAQHASNDAAAAVGDFVRWLKSGL